MFFFVLKFGLLLVLLKKTHTQISKVFPSPGKSDGIQNRFDLFWPREKHILSLFSFHTKHKIGQHGDDEIQRQNRITAQIVANYLERRLFPFKRPTHRLPTVDEILPTAAQQPNHHSTAETKTKFTRQLEHGSNSAAPPNTDNDDIGDDDYVNDETINEQDIDPNDPENLQSVESNHVDSYYNEMNESISNDNEGRFLFIFTNKCFFFF